MKTGVPLRAFFDNPGMKLIFLHSIFTEDWAYIILNMNWTEVSKDVITLKYF